MNGESLHEVEPGVFKLISDEVGPDNIEHNGITYYRFMDLFYIKNKHLDRLAPDDVSNLCRARAKFPESISTVNDDVRNIFKTLVEEIAPHSLLEVGVGLNPIFGEEDATPKDYVLADADGEVIAHYANSPYGCYMFSQGTCEIPSLENFFEMVIAVFVLHFPFHTEQLLELSRRLSKSGIIVANIYRRDLISKEVLTQEIISVGFKIVKVPDSENLCRNHEYWVIGKEDEYVETCAKVLSRIIESS